MTKEFNDYPIEEVQQTLIKLNRIRPVHWHQKFTCEKCGSRQTMEDMDKLYAFGKCEECGHTTDLRVAGCNYLLIV